VNGILKYPPEGVPAATFNPAPAPVDSKIATLLYDKTLLVPDAHPSVTRAEVIRRLAVFESELETLVDNHDEATAVHMLWNAIVSPIHLSSNGEIDVMVKTLECALRQLGDKQRSPALITLARSQRTPTHLVKHIDCSLYRMLRSLYSSNEIYYDADFDADSSQCDLGFQFRSIEGLPAEQEPQILPTPVELVIANVSPEPLLVRWRSQDGELANEFFVAPFSYDTANCISFDDHHWLVTTTDGVVVDEKRVSAKDGHTQLWSITTGQVDTALRSIGIMRHRVL